MVGQSVGLFVCLSVCLSVYLFIRRFNRQQTHCQGGPKRACYATTKSGWMENSFKIYINKIFVGATKDLKKPFVLIYDGHNSHLTYHMVKACIENDIIKEECTKHRLVFKKKNKPVGRMKQILGSFVIKNVQIEHEDFDNFDFDALQEAT